MTKAKTISKTHLISPEHLFSNEFHSKLQGHSLYIDRKLMDMVQLELLVEIGFKMDNELLKPYYDAINTAKSQLDKKKGQEKEEVKEDAEIISRMAWKKLIDSYRYYIINYK